MLNIFNKFRFSSRARYRNDLGSSAPAHSEITKPALTDTDMPPLEELGEGSDYRQFLSEGVSDSLRTQALRKLFRLPKYNVTDGLDDYTENYHRYESLGDIVTADIRHQLQRKLGEKTKEELVQNEVTGEEAEESPEQQV